MCNWWSSAWIFNEKKHFQIVLRSSALHAINIWLHLSCRLHDTLQVVIKTVNKIKAYHLNTRLFRYLCHKNEEEFECLLLHTEVRWLSKEDYLQHFIDIFFSSMFDFLKPVDKMICIDLKTRELISHILLIFLPNEMKKTRNGRKARWALLKQGIIRTFINKIEIYKKKNAKQVGTFISFYVYKHWSALTALHCIRIRYGCRLL